MSSPSYGAPGRRVVFNAYGDTPTDSIDQHLAIEDQPPPDPTTLKNSDVIIRVRAAAVGWVDLLMSNGQYQHQLQPPYTPGLEYTGEVVWAGDAVSNCEVGDRVIADGFLTGPRSLGDYQLYGGFATYAVAPSQAVLQLPENISFDQGASLLGAYETAYHCLIHRGRIDEGETVLIHGASGTTGLAAVHIAKIRGAKVIATGRNARKLEEVAKQGADHVVCTRDENGENRGFREEVKRITPKGVDVVYDGVGGDITIESLRSIRFGGRYLIVGWAATPLAGRKKGANTIPTNLIMMKSVDVLGCPAVISAHKDPGMRKARLEKIMEWVKAGRIQPVVSKAFALEDAKEALRTKWRSDFVGNCVLHP